jgi:hypothetical protein
LFLVISVALFIAAHVPALAPIKDTLLAIDAALGIGAGVAMKPMLGAGSTDDPK